MKANTAFLLQPQDRRRRSPDRHRQLDLFPGKSAPAPIDPVIGLAVRLTGLRCSCGSRLAVIAAGVGPHVAGLECSRCECFRGWLPKATHAFLTEIIRNFGRPAAPIRIGRGSRATNPDKQTAKENAAPDETTQQTN